MTKDPTHLPENVQAILKALPVHDQVVLRSYIASLREHVKDLEHKLLVAEDADPHGGYTFASSWETFSTPKMFLSFSQIPCTFT